MRYAVQRKSDGFFRTGQAWWHELPARAKLYTKIGQAKAAITHVRASEYHFRRQRELYNENHGKDYPVPEVKEYQVVPVVVSFQLGDPIPYPEEDKAVQ